MKFLHQEFFILAFGLTTAFCCELQPGLNPFITSEDGNLELNVTELWRICPDGSEMYSFYYKSVGSDFIQENVTRESDGIQLNATCCDSVTWYLDTGKGETVHQKYPNLNVVMSELNPDSVTFEWSKIEVCCFKGVNVTIEGQEGHQFIPKEQNFTVLSVKPCLEVEIQFDMVFDKNDAENSLDIDPVKIPFKANPSKDFFQIHINVSHVDYNESALLACKAVERVDYHAEIRSESKVLETIMIHSSKFEDFTIDPKSFEEEEVLENFSEEMLNEISCKKVALSIIAQVKRGDERSSTPITLVDNFPFPNNLNQTQCKNSSETDKPVDEFKYNTEDYTEITENTVLSTSGNPPAIQTSEARSQIKDSEESKDQGSDNSNNSGKANKESNRKSAIVGLALFGVVLFIFLTALSAILIKGKIRKIKMSEMKPAWEDKTNIDLDETRSNEIEVQKGLLVPSKQTETKVDVCVDQTSVKTIDVADLDANKAPQEIKDPEEFTEISLDTPNENPPAVSTNP